MSRRLGGLRVIVLLALAAAACGGECSAILSIGRRTGQDDGRRQARADG
jgi:hypothetical protein